MFNKLSWKLSGLVSRAASAIGTCILAVCLMAVAAVELDARYFSGRLFGPLGAAAEEGFFHHRAERSYIITSEDAAEQVDYGIARPPLPPAEPLPPSPPVIIVQSGEYVEITGEVSVDIDGEEPKEIREIDREIREAVRGSREAVYKINQEIRQTVREAVGEVGSWRISLSERIMEAVNAVSGMLLR